MVWLLFPDINKGEVARADMTKKDPGKASTTSQMRWIACSVLYPCCSRKRKVGAGECLYHNIPFT